MADLLGGALRRADPERDLRPYAIWTFWNDTVGELLARNAQPVAFRNGVLFVSVTTHSWMQELQFMKADLRRRLNDRLHAELVRDLALDIGLGSAPPPAPPALVADPTEPVALPAIADAQLAAAMRRVVAARARHLTRVRQAPTAPRPPRRRRRARRAVD